MFRPGGPTQRWALEGLSAACSDHTCSPVKLHCMSFSASVGCEGITGLSASDGGLLLCSYIAGTYGVIEAFDCLLLPCRACNLVPLMHSPSHSRRPLIGFVFLSYL
ncbi:hypothetical protein FKM82_025657 [Ascaphus truei]